MCVYHFRNKRLVMTLRASADDDQVYITPSYHFTYYYLISSPEVTKVTKTSNLNFFFLKCRFFIVVIFWFNLALNLHLEDVRWVFFYMRPRVFYCYSSEFKNHSVSISYFYLLYIVGTIIWSSCVKKNTFRKNMIFNNIGLYFGSLRMWIDCCF